MRDLTYSSTYAGLSSMPMKSRPSSWATLAVVPDPMKGSRMIQRAEPAFLHLQGGCQPLVAISIVPRGKPFHPFIGSGTTAKVALELGRDFIGIELNPAYVEEQVRSRIAVIEPRLWKAGEGAVA